MTLAYRVFPYLSTAKTEKDGGHPGYLHRPQTTGRLDNGMHYDTWYLSETPEGAIGETFGNFKEWSDGMFNFKYVPGARKVLGVFDVPDDISLLDLDNATNLVDRALRPRQVVIRDRRDSQAWAKKIFEERDDFGKQVFDGVKWWSYQNPKWTIYGIWTAPSTTPPFQYLHHEDLDLDHYAVKNVLKSIPRQTRR